MKLHPNGVFCAALTPLQADLSPDLPLFVEHCHRLIEQGCNGVALLGTTGEANSFSVDERKALLEAAIDGGVAPNRLMPGTGVAALPETIALTRHALSLGVTTVVMLPPFYYKGVTDEGVYAAYAHVLDNVADDRLRVVLYHIPQMSAVPLSHELIERLRDRYPGTVVGIKDSSGDLANMIAMVERFPGFSVLAGADPLMLPLLEAGGAGCITATANLIAADLAIVFRHFADPTKAEEVAAAQARIVAARNRASIFAQAASLKAMLGSATGHPGWNRMRPPLMPLSDTERDTLLAS
jgi:4-hydroxy-tetrahydrodipicolinate synthase